MDIPPVFLIIGGAIALGTSFLVPGLGALSFVAFVPLFVFAMQSSTKRGVFQAGCMFGTLYLLMVFSWLWSAFPAEWLIPSPILSALAIGLIWISVAILGGALLGGMMLVVRFVWQVGRGYAPAERVVMFVVLGGVLLALFSYMHMFSIAFVFAGEWGIQPFISYGAPGYLLADFAGLRTLGVLGDVYVLSGLVGAVSALLAYIWCMFREKIVHSVVLISIMLLVSNAFLIPPEHVGTDSVHVLGIGLDVPSEFERTLPARRVVDALSTKDAFVIFPEGFGQNILSSNTGDSFMVLYSGRTVDSKKRAFSTAFLESSTTRAVTQKTLLATGGEYVPIIVSQVFGIVSPQTLHTAQTLFDVVPGNVSHALASPVGNIGVLFCNEIASPEFTARVVARGARLLVVIASHSWFPNSSSLEEETLRVLQVRAVSTQTPIVQVANQGNSFSITRSGNVQARAGVGEVLDTVVSLP